mmetsp:Transcript_1329/g.2077  ORF Transcript_1329/g.2077 Transcript_1329/m.2077 type:complete len:466 (+) Transcript_1329:109-1506(+)
MDRQSNRTLRNPYSSKSKSPMRLVSALASISLLILSALYTVYVILPIYDVDTGTGSADNTSQNDSAVSASTSAHKTTSTNVDFTNAPEIAYAVSLSSCEETPSLIDGAAVLAHSIHLSSIQNPKSGSKYNYKMYAIVHKSASNCQPILEKIGYQVKLVDVPVALEDIQGDFLRENVHQNGCCGELEFIKLWAYTFVEHPFVVHMDLDTMVLKPMDELFDAALSGDTTKVDSVMWSREHKTRSASDPLSSSSSSLDAFYTRDYNMRSAKKGNTKPTGVQGGFLVLRPSMQVFQEFQDIIRKGDFRRGKGWGGLGFGPFYGSMTFQGIIPYYYDALHPGTAVELNRCVYNQMADNPRDKRTVNDVVSGNCRDGRDDCEDCRDKDIGSVVSAHFTLCQKPWHCLPHGQDLVQHRLCRKLFKEWYGIRADLEQPGVGDTIAVGEGTFEPEHFRGFCRSDGKHGYIPLKI